MESQTQGQDVLQGNIQTSERSDRNAMRPLPFDRWSDEEVAVLRKWQRDSFWFRSVPYSAAFAFGTEYLILRGRLQGLARWPRFLRVSLTLFCGFVLGKSTSLSELHRRLLEQCPDGAVASYIRQTQESRKNQQQRRGQQQSETLQRSDSEDRTAFPSQGVSSEVIQEPNKAPESSVTQSGGKGMSYYDRLREQNKYSTGSSELPALQKQPPKEKQEPVFFADKPQTSKQRGKKNKYGDDWED